MALNARHQIFMPVVFTFVALILTLVCIFAGSQKGRLENYSIITLNTAEITTPSMINLSGESLRPIDEGLESAARELGLYDYYSIYMLDYCEGYYKGVPQQRDTVYCSQAGSFFTFNAFTTLQDNLDSNSRHLSLNQIGFPTNISMSLNDLSIAFHVIFVIYGMSLVMTGITLLSSFVSVVHPRRLLALVNMAMASTATFFLMIASAIVTGASATAAKKINQYGASINVSASKGTALWGITWSATLLMALSTFIWFIEFVLHKRRERVPDSDPEPEGDGDGDGDGEGEKAAPDA